jgi:phosphoacetylglucosamine mutase
MRDCFDTFESDSLQSSWEEYATLLANTASDTLLGDVYEQLYRTLRVRPDSPARVIFARDTRASGPSLVEALVDALKAAGSEYTDYGILTTPQLHYLVRCVNTKGSRNEYGDTSEKGYYEKLASAYKKAMEGRRAHDAVTVDCANGVGGGKLKELIKYLPRREDGGVEIKVVNDDVSHPEHLNYQVSSLAYSIVGMLTVTLKCGADYVKTQQRPPPSSHASPLARCASLDGDADRIVYYFIDSDSTFRLLDGDKIAILAASFIRELARSAGIADKINMGVVQTAYANGSSTDYITKHLKIPVECTPTGVKHLHHAAARFDVGVYFEANGHGTVLFSSNFFEALGQHEPQSPAQKSAMDTLHALADLINQTVGDALSDLLLVEVILAHKGWGPKEWDGMYTDLPNRLVRIEVRDRTRFKAVDAERKLAEPEDVQEQIDALVAKYKQGRSFVRASGTEDAVRVYAEATTRREADELATKVSILVKQADETL